ncbi:MAG: VWA domain-containing protein [Inquilinus sp.]|nr:VWA domain-containing protein [Inquilinus sp.]
MLARRQRTLDLLSISALDLFASALGVFVLMAVLLFPFYLKAPSIEADLAGAEAEQQAAGLALSEARRLANEAEEARAAAEALRTRAIDEVQEAEASKAEAESRLTEAMARSHEIGEQTASLEDELEAIAIPDLDLVFVMDTTSSMRREIADVQTNLLGIIRVLHRLAPTLNVGFVAYRDVGDDYVTRPFPLTPMEGDNLAHILTFVEKLQARGGGDRPEAVGRALDEAYSMAWRGDAQGRVVLIGDAPDRPERWRGIFAEAERFRRRTAATGLRWAVSAIYTGNRPDGNRFFKGLAETGGGDFIDHEGRMMESVLLSILDPAS